MDKKKLFALMDTSAADFEQISDQIWDFAEVAYQEYRSSALQMEYLKNQGFHIINPIGLMETAFYAEYGEGKPVIGYLGEYDALPGLSQVADADCPQPIEGQDAGHGCGHNLLGAGAMEAACTIKKLIESGELRGTVRYYGCPAEEGGSGKVFMMREGVFDDLDAVFSWHPSFSTNVNLRTMSCVMAHYKFHGKSSHASAAWMGRSALDAAELMNVGVNFLREHVPDGVRIQYAFTNAGGPKANTVQKDAELYYVIRTGSNALTKEVLERVSKVAKGAATMTETEMEGPIITGAYARDLFNEPLMKLVDEQAKLLYPIAYTPEENAYAARYKMPERRGSGQYLPVYGGDAKGVTSLTTDYADVSFAAPGVFFTVATTPIATMLHAWDGVAVGKSAGAHRGIHMAAKIMAAATAELMERPELVAEVRAEFEKQLSGEAYVSILPEDAKPAICPRL